MKKADLDLYTDYLLSTFGSATATGLSAMVDGEVSHDQITRFLSKQDYDSRDLWLKVKSKPTQSTMAGPFKFKLGVHVPMMST